MVLALAVGVFAAGKGEVVQTVGDGNASINWTTGLITASGLGPPPKNPPPSMARAIQRRIAMVDAMRHLAEAVHGVAVTSETTVEMYELTSDVIKAKMSALLKGHQVVSEGLEPDGTNYRVTLAVPLTPQNPGGNSIATVLLGEGALANEKKVAQADKASQAKSAPAAARAVEIPEEQPPPPTPLPERKPGPYTGLVVDTRGFKLERALSPKIVTSDEEVIWGNVKVSREFVLNTGIVGFLSDLDAALDPEKSRAGNNPLILRAIGRAGSFRANAVLTDEDAELLLKENGKGKFLEEFKVVFVIDPEK